MKECLIISFLRMTLRLTQLFQGENIDKIFEYPGDKSKMLTVQFATSHLDENERERER